MDDHGIIVYLQRDEDGYDDDELWAVYGDGTLRHEGESISDLLSALEELGVLRCRGGDIYLGSDDSIAAKTVAEIEQFRRLPEHEREARELEAQARRLQEQARQIRTRNRDD